MTAIEILKQPFTLPCGVQIPNRFCKSAMSENMADKGGKPSDAIIELYRRWSAGGAGILISGNVMVDHRALGEPKNVVIEDETHLAELQKWAEAAQQNGSHLWMQINHPGRQAPKKLNKELVSPSDVGLSKTVLFDPPRPLKESEIWKLIEGYGTTAFVAKKAGFKGVQIHGAHGYLVSQFLSPITNKRTDQWGGSLENRAKFVVEIYRSMRQKVGADYPVGIKINSADFQRGGFTEEESLDVISILSEEGIDMIEVSGGTYEKAAMMGMAQDEMKESTKKREAYFADFIVKARKQTDTPLMLTGGFRTLDVMADAVRNNELDFVGLARPFALNPNVASDFLSGKLTHFESRTPKVGIKFIDKMGFIDTLWHGEQLAIMGDGKAPNPKRSAWKTLFNMAKRM